MNNTATNNPLVRKAILSAKAWSKKARKDILIQTPTACKFQKLHVPGVGYTYYIKDANGNDLGTVDKGLSGQMEYLIKLR